MTKFRNRYKSFTGLLTAAVALLVLLLSGTANRTAAAQEKPTREKLGVCADPYMLPFSNREKEGYENKIAQLMADKLGAELHYKFFPQRRGFIRNTLRSQGRDGNYACDLVITVPQGFELAATTRPYYTTTYVLVYAKQDGLPEVDDAEAFAEQARKMADFKMGLSTMGSAQGLWVRKHELMDRMIPYSGMPGDPKHNPGELMMQDIASGKIDAAIVFGPTAGYYSQKLSDKADFVKILLRNDPENPNLRFEFSVAMAVRYGEEEWKQTVNTLLEENREEIYAILREYGVPLLPLKVAPETDDDD